MDLGTESDFREGQTENSGKLEKNAQFPRTLWGKFSNLSLKYTEPPI